MSWPFRNRTDPQDFSAFVKDEPSSQKRLLIAECKRRGVSIFIDNPNESSSGVYASTRGVASEAELQNRLHQANTSRIASRTNLIAWLALAVSCASLLVAIVK